MADAQKGPSQAPPQEENPILLAKKRAAERIKARFHQEDKHNMNMEKAHQWYLQQKDLEKKQFSKEKQLEAMRQRLFYIAPRVTIERLIKEAQAA